MVIPPIFWWGFRRMAISDTQCPWDGGRSAGMALQRSRKHKMIAGVCGGIAEWLGWDPTVVRVLYVVVSILSVAFPGILLYVVLWAVIPKAPE
jgi:phage shock protein PspC (stress-responsive transcriptional regulator)